MTSLCIVVKFVLYAIILTLLVVLLTREGFKNSARLKPIDPQKMFKSRTQQFDANTSLRGNVIDYFDGYLPTQIKFNSRRIDMDKWAARQKQGDIKRAVDVAQLAGFM
jgi:hypothetical protein